jgi:hypothetical protein
LRQRLRSCLKTQFPLRAAAISTGVVVGVKFVLNVCLIRLAAILNFRLARENFARFRVESSFETAFNKNMGLKSTVILSQKSPELDFDCFPLKLREYAAN